jgi:hypothetical protein
MGATDDTKAFIYLYQTAHIPMSVLSDSDKQFQNDLYAGLISNLYDPKHLPHADVYSLAYGLSKLESLTESIETVLTPQAKFLINYFVALRDECSHAYAHNRHFDELSVAYVHQ